MAEEMEVVDKELNGSVHTVQVLPPKPVESRLQRARRLLTIEPLFFLFMFSGSLQLPTTQALMYQKVCWKLYLNHTICDNLKESMYKTEEDIVQSSSSHWFLYENLCFEVPSIFFAFFYGSISDNFSRRMALILPSIGQVISCINFIINSVYMEWHVAYLMIGRLSSGIFGGWVTCCMAGFSYLSEVTDNNSRTTRIAIAESVISISIALSLFISGLILEGTSFQFVYSLGMVLYLMCIIYVCLWIKEPAAKQKNTNLSLGQKIKSIFGPTQIKKTFLSVFRKRSLNKRAHILAIFAMVFTGMLAFGPSWFLSYLYLKRQPLSWSTARYGIYLGYAMGLRSICQVILVPLLKKKFHTRETAIMLTAGVQNLATQVLFGLSQVTWLVFLVPVVSFLGFADITCARSILSMLVDKDELGQMFAMFGSLQSLSMLASSMIFNNIYPLTLHFFAGFCFIAGSVLAILPLIVNIWLHISLKKSEKTYNTLESETTHEEEADLLANEELQDSDSEILNPIDELDKGATDQVVGLSVVI